MRPSSSPLALHGPALAERPGGARQARRQRRQRNRGGCPGLAGNRARAWPSASVGRRPTAVRRGARGADGPRSPRSGRRPAHRRHRSKLHTSAGSTHCLSRGTALSSQKVGLRCRPWRARACVISCSTSRKSGCSGAPVRRDGPCTRQRSGRSRPRTRTVALGQPPARAATLGAHPRRIVATTMDPGRGSSKRARLRAVHAGSAAQKSDTSWLRRLWRALEEFALYRRCRLGATGYEIDAGQHDGAAEGGEGMDGLAK